MTTTDEARAELAQRVGHSLSEFIDDYAPLNERYYVMGAEHVIRKFGLVEERPITEEQVDAVLEHRWHPPTGRCACGQHFDTLREFVLHTLEAAIGAQS